MPAHAVVAEERRIAELKMAHLLLPLHSPVQRAHGGQLRQLDGGGGRGTVGAGLREAAVAAAAVEGETQPFSAHGMPPSSHRHLR